MVFSISDLDVIRRRERDDPIDNRKLARAIALGTWTRVTPGVFVRSTDWRALRPLERHRLLVEEAARRRRTPVVFSHFAAAALWEIDVLGSWPRLVDISVPSAGGGRSSGSIRRHGRDMALVEVQPWGQHLVTSPRQTALDLARALPFVEGVAVVDQASWSARSGGALASIDDIAARLDEEHLSRGAARASRAVAFADPLAANVRESQSRVVIARLGFPRPRLQERRVLRSGRLAFGDFFWPEHDHWGELDGRGKYLSPEFGRDRPIAEIVLDEKQRENEVRREVRGFSRWEPSDADDPRRLYDILTGDGLPSALPRP